VTPALEAAYAEPRRRYHTRAHVEDCLARLAEVPGLSEGERLTLELALWWHDAVYDPRRPDNEEASAAMARTELTAMGIDADTIADVERLILLTKGHRVAPGDRLGAIMVSVDLSILGAAPETYDAYARGVRQEYAHAPDAAFRAGRRRVLESFLASPEIFPDPGFRQRFEAAARCNLRRELEALE